MPPSPDPARLPFSRDRSQARSIMLSSFFLFSTPTPQRRYGTLFYFY